MRIRGYIGPDPLFHDGFPPFRSLAEQFTTAIFKRPDRGTLEHPVGTAGVILAPLMRCRIIQEQRHAFEMAKGAICLYFLQRSPAIPDFPDLDRAVDLDPGTGIRENVQPPLNMCVPVTEIEVEVVLAVS